MVEHTRRHRPACHRRAEGLGALGGVPHDEQTRNLAFAHRIYLNQPIRRQRTAQSLGQRAALLLARADKVIR